MRENGACFHYQDERLWCDGVALDAIAAETGTPVYIYSAGSVRHNVARLRAAFDPLGASIHYSLKANANLALVRLLHGLGLGVDAVSAGEIHRARQAGIAGHEIIFAGVGKTRAELVYALDERVGWFNVESVDELRTLNTLAGERGQQPAVALRLNPGILAQTHKHIATGHYGAKFGLDAHVVADILAHRAEYPHLNISGLHIHIGSQLGEVRETVAAVRAARDLALPYPDVRTLNIGGGFPVAYTDADSYPSPAAFAEALAPVLHGWHVMIEPGRSLVADAGLLLITVLTVKLQGEVRFVVTDGSMTELLRPALYDAVHPVIPVQAVGEGIALSAAVVVGPVCESTDVLHRDARLPDMAPGDRLAVLVVGAYGMTMASNYNLRMRPPEVLVDGDTWRVVRRRETWDDLLRLELP